MHVEKSVYDALVERAATAPNALAVVDGLHGRRVDYAELAHDVATFAGKLTAFGDIRGRVISVQLPNTYYAVVVDLAVIAAGAVLNPLLPNYRGNELLNVVRTADPTLVVTPRQYRGFEYEPMMAAVVAETGSSMTHLMLDQELPAGAGSSTRVLAAPSGNDAALSELIFTSGTQARPKAVLHSERTTNGNALALASALRLAATDPVWVPSPVGHSSGLNFGLRLSVLLGATMVLQDIWNGAEAAELIERERCSYTLSAVTFLRDLLDAAKADGRDVSSMRAFACGGAPVPPATVAEADAIGVRTLRLYGSTEGLVMTCHRPDATDEARRVTDGPALDGVEVGVIDDAGGLLGLGAVGEIVTRGPNVAEGLLVDGVAHSPVRDANGWMRTEDIGSLDESGNLQILGRKKEIVIRGGMNISAREVEEAILTLPRVRDVAVVPVADARLGEHSCAFVVLDDADEMTLSELAGGLRAANLAVYKLPEDIRCVPSLPRTPTGKVQKYLLQQTLTSSVKSTPARSEPEVLMSDIELGRGAVALSVVLNRPDTLNALNWKMARGVLAALDAAERRPEVRVVLVSGAGRAFSSGGDLLAYSTLQLDPVAFPAFVRDFHEVLQRMRALPVPVVAAVHGFATAGGLELLLGADVVIAGRSARIGDCHVNYGQMGGGGTLSLLSRVVGIRRATDLIFSGRLLDAETALDWGLVTALADDDDVVAAAVRLATNYAQRSPAALAGAKTVMNRAWADRLPLQSSLELEQQANSYYCLTSPDPRDGLAAFADKREPVFPPLRGIATKPGGTL